MKEKKTALQRFSTNSSSHSNGTCFVLFVFSESDGEFTEQPLACSILPRCTDSDEKQTHKAHIMVFGWSPAMMTLCLHLFFHIASDLTQDKINFQEEVVLPWIERVSIGISDVWQQDSAQCHRSRKTQCWLSENFCDHITQTSGRLTSQTATPLIIICGVRLSEKTKKKSFMQHQRSTED